MIMDAKLEREQQEHPPLVLKCECNICKIEFTKTVIYHNDITEYEKFADAIEKLRSIEENDEELEGVVFLDVCSDCRKKNV